MKLDRTPACGLSFPDLVEQGKKALTVTEPPHRPQHLALACWNDRSKVGGHTRPWTPMTSSNPGRSSAGCR